MNVTKDFDIIVDMYEPLDNERFTVVEGDTANVLHIHVVDNGEPVDLTGCKIVVVFAKGGQPVEQDSDGNGVTVSGDDNNIIDVELYSSSYTNGENTAQVQIFSGDGLSMLATTSRFNFNGEKAIANEDTLLTTVQWPLLVAALNTLDGIARGVQADMEITDDADPAFVKNKPDIPATPEDIGAAEETHASQHASGGADAITPASILAAGKSALANATLLAANWQAINRASSATYNDSTGIYELTMRTEWSYAADGIVCFTCPEAVTSATTIYIKIGTSTYTCSTVPTWAADDDVAVKLLTAATCEEASVSEDTPVYYDYANADITALNTVVIIPGLSITEEEYQELQGLNLLDGGQVLGSATFKTFGSAPTSDLPVRVKIMEDLY